MDGRLILNGRVLKQLRQQQHLSQEEMANACTMRRLQVSLSSIKRAESGMPVRYRIARELACFFNISVDTLQTPACALAAEPDAIPIISLVTDRPYQQAVSLLEQVLNLPLSTRERHTLVMVKNQLAGELPPPH